MHRINQLVLLLALTACSPTIYNLGVEVRQPSKSGLDLAGKTLAVVYDESSVDTAFNYAFAEGFATSLEKDYFNGERAVGIYSVDFGKGDYSQRDSMVSLVMQTDADVIFVLENPELGALVQSGTNTIAPVTVKLYAYDAMGGDKDKVRSFNGTANLSGVGHMDSVEFRKILNSNASKLGTNASASFLSTWKEESFPVYYFDSAASGWLDATRDAASFKWKEAIEKWMKLLDTKSAEKKACAEYNIATGCFLLGDPALALKWLDRADADCPVSLSPQLRRMIEKK